MKPPIETVSCATVPAALPDPYVITTLESAEVLALKVEDAEVSKSLVERVQEVHVVSASQRSAEPVSSTTEKFCGLDQNIRLVGQE